MSSSESLTPSMAEGRHDAIAAATSLTVVSRTDFAVLVPAFNEAPVIEDTIRELKRAFEQYDLRGEVIVIDDGSTDGTAELAETAGAGWDALTVVRHRRNLGKTEAMVTGASKTQRDCLVIFDADLQHEPDEIPRFLLGLQSGWDVVTARKVGEYSKAGVSSVYNRLSRLIFKVPVSDLNSMKAFKAEVLDGLHLRHDWHRFFVVLAHARGHTITEIDVPLFPRKAGEAKYQGSFRIVVGVLDLISVWFLLIFSRKPMLLFGTSGVALIGLGFLVGVIAFIQRFGFGQGFRPMLYLVILLETVGFLLFGFGLVAELIAQLRDEVDSVRRQLSDASEPADYEE